MKRIYDIFLNETLVGYLSEGDNELISFRFDPSYYQLPNRPILGQAFEDNLKKIYSGKKTAQLPPFFANLIPEEGELRRLIEVNLSAKDDLSILQFLGLDLPGAILVKPSENAISDLFVEEDPFVNSEESVISSENLNLRFSLAGVQLKFSVNREKDRLTIPLQGLGGNWIVKIDSKNHPHLVENEFVMMEWARASGFDVPLCKLEESSILSPELQKFAPKGSKIFVIQRYDRLNGYRIHQEDFTQITGFIPNLKYDHITYETLAVLINKIIDENAYFEYIRRLAFMIATGNTDLHLKNWSVIYPDGQNAKLAPLYDQVFILAWEDFEPSLALKFASIKHIRRIDEEAFKRLAERAGMDPTQTVFVMNECLENIYKAWNSFEEKIFLPTSHYEKLREYWQSAPLLRKFV